MEIPPLILPVGVSDEPKKLLSADRVQKLVEAVRQAGPSLADQMSTLELMLSADADKVALQDKAPTSASRMDRFDWFFLVERAEEDSDLTGLVALHRTMTEYAGLLTSMSILTDLEEATLSEAVQSIVENYGEQE